MLSTQTSVETSLRGVGSMPLTNIFYMSIAPATQEVQSYNRP
jgi:hypothetical protein